MADYDFKKAEQGQGDLFIKDVARNKIEREITILIDTREPIPWKFDYETKKLALKAGDYSIAVLLNGRKYRLDRRFAVERKASVEDFLAALFEERERFKQELNALRRCDIAGVICEFDLEDVMAGLVDRKITPASVWHTILSFQALFKIPFVFAGNEARAKDAFLALARVYIRSRILGLS